MDQYKENENNPTNENDGKEPVIPEPEFEEVKAHQPMKAAGSPILTAARRQAMQTLLSLPLKIPLTQNR